jgi:hypothetical protein
MVTLNTDNGFLGNDMLKTASIAGAKIKTASIAAAAIKTNVLTNTQLKFFFTKKSTGKGTRTFAHSLGAAPKIAIAYSLKNVTKVAFAYTFGATNVIANNPSLTTSTIIFAM